MIYYIGDTHFGHANVIKHDGRPFETVEEMDEAIIRNWNRRVQKDDDVYVLGDFCFRNTESCSWYLQKLKGRKHLIVGNHDSKLLKDEKALSMLDSVDHMTVIRDNGKQITLCHYPMASWDGSHHGSWHIYAHIHNNDGPVTRYMFSLSHAVNAGCMIHYYAPVTFEELVTNYQNYIRNTLLTYMPGDTAYIIKDGAVTEAEVQDTDETHMLVLFGNNLVPAVNVYPNREIAEQYI